MLGYFGSYNSSDPFRVGQFGRVTDQFVNDWDRAKGIIADLHNNYIRRPEDRPKFKKPAEPPKDNSTVPEHNTTRTADEGHARVNETQYTTPKESQTADTPHTQAPAVRRVTSDRFGGYPQIKTSQPKQQVFASIVKPKGRQFFDDGRKTRDNVNNVRMSNASYIAEQSKYHAVYSGSQLAR